MDPEVTDRDNGSKKSLLAAGRAPTGSGTWRFFKSSSAGSRISLIYSHENEVSSETKLQADSHWFFWTVGHGNENFSTGTPWVRHRCSDGCSWCWEDSGISSWRAQELVKIIFIEASEKTVQWLTEERQSGGRVCPQWASSLSDTPWGGRRGESVGSSITVGVPFKGLKAKHLYCKTLYSPCIKCTRTCISTRAPKIPRGVHMPYGGQCNKGRRRHALPTPGIPKAFI